MVSTAPPADTLPGGVTLPEATRTWLKIGLLSFGGPAGQIALMHRLLVDEKRWISEARFLHALNFCMLLPGPEAQQLATYVGWLLHGVRGGLVAGVLFILPGAVVIFLLSYLYVLAGTLPWLHGLFDGLKAAVIVIVVQAVLRIGARSLRSRAPVGVAVAAFLAMFAWHVPFPAVIVTAALFGAMVFRPDPEVALEEDPIHQTNVGRHHLLKTVALFGTLCVAPTALLAASLGTDNVFATIGMFFTKMAVVTFGGAYAVLAYVSQEAVATYGWLAPGEMIDGLALAETTPGPLILVTQFVGFLAGWRDPGVLPAWLGGLAGGLLTTWVTFVPCFLWIFAGAPYLERVRRNRWLAGALAGVTAAVVGVIGNLAVWFSIHALFDDVTRMQLGWAVLDVPILASLRIAPALITIVAAGLLFRAKVSIPIVLAAAGAMGLASTILVP